MATTSRPASTSTSTSTRPTISSPNPNNRASTTTNQTNQSGQTPAPYVVNTQTRVLDSAHGRILCVADIRGRLSAINDLAREAGAHAVIHTGDFGLFESASLDRIHDRTLRHLTMYSPLIPSAQRNHLLSADNPPSTIRSTLTISMLSEFPLLLSGQIKLQVPVYTVAGACEDVLVLERFRTGEYAIENLTVLDEATTRVLDVGGLKLRLLGLGGAFVPHKMFDNGEGNATIAGGGGTVWTTTLQIGELVDTAQRVYDPAETRLLITHASPGREGILSSLALVLKADLTISAGLHFRYATSWNEFSVQGDYEGFRTKLRAGRDAFERVWDSVKGQVDAVIDDHQRVLLDKALSVIERVPPALGTVPPGSNGPAATEEPAWKNCWNWNLCDAAYGSLVLDLREGRVSAELKSQGFNYAYRRSAASGAPATGAAMATGTPGATQMSKAPTPAPAPVQAPSTTSAEPAPAPPPAQKPTTASSTPGSATPATTNGAEKDAQKEAQKAKKKEKKKEKKEAARAGAGAAPSSSDPPKSAGAGGGAGGAEGGWGAADGEDPWSESAAAGGAGAGSEANAGGEADKPKMVEVEGWGMVEDDDPWAAKSGSASTAQPPQPSQQQAHTPRGWGGGDEGGESLASPSTTGGARTPTGKRPPRNPWTLFMRLPVPASEDEIREFFLEAKAGITKVNIPSSYAGRERKIAYVEFGDEDAMKAALDGHAEKLNDAVPDVKQADREPRDGTGGGGDFRGRGRGRGGRGGYASRAFAQGGLTRGGKPNGNAP